MSDKYGLSSDFGFAYQRCAFVYEIISKCINPNDVISYEKDDDLSSVTITANKRVSQCKTGDISEDIFVKIFKNWLLLDGNEINSYVLVLEKDTSFSPNLDGFVDSIIDEVIKYHDKKRTSSASILFKLGCKYNYHDGAIDELSLKNDLENIINKYIKIVVDYDELNGKSFNEFTSRYCNDVLYNQTIKEKRFERLLFLINQKINDNESKKQPTSIDFQELSREISTITKEINDKDPYYMPYTMFKKANLTTLKENEQIMNLREVKFLKKVFPNDENKVFDNLIYECYYQDLRGYYSGISKYDKILDAEGEVKFIYDISDRSEEINIFYNNVLKQLSSAKIEILMNHYYRNGALLFLSSDNCDEELFLDWNGENAK